MAATCKEGHQIIHTSWGRLPQGKLLAIRIITEHHLLGGAGCLGFSSTLSARCSCCFQPGNLCRQSGQIFVAKPSCLVNGQAILNAAVSQALADPFHLPASGRHYPGLPLLPEDTVGHFGFKSSLQAQEACQMDYLLKVLKLIWSLRDVTYLQSLWQGSKSIKLE